MGQITVTNENAKEVLDALYAWAFALTKEEGAEVKHKIDQGGGSSVIVRQLDSPLDRS